MTDSAASALAFLGYERLAVLLGSTRRDESKMENPMAYVGNILQKDTVHSERKTFEYLALNTKRLRRWDPLVSPKEYLLCIVGIRSSDGKSDHAICIVNGEWIFDSNFEKALSFDAISLDLCSSSEDRATKFVEMTRGHLLRSRA